MNWLRKLLVATATAGVMAVLAGGAIAYPDKPITIVVPFPPGGPTDVFARLIGEALQRELDNPVVVENRPGGGALIGTSAVANAEPDGHTLLFTASTHVISIQLRSDKPYDPIEDFAPISPVITYPFYLLASNDLEVENIGELIEYGRANPDELSFGSVGVGSGAHLVAELFNARAGIDAVHIPYNGASEFLVALQSGQIDYIFDSPGSATPYVQAGQMRGLAVTSEERWPLIPEIPTVGEEAIDGFEASLWLGLLAPGETPDEIVERLNGVVSSVLASESFSTRTEEMGFDVLSESTSAFRERLIADFEQWGAVIADGDISLD